MFMVINGEDFWKRVDKINPYPTIAKLISITDIDYGLIKKQRFDRRIPKTADSYEIAKALNTSLEFLLTGIEPMKLPDRIEKIVFYLEHLATEEDFRLVERILRIPAERSANAECC